MNLRRCRPIPQSSGQCSYFFLRAVAILIVLGLPSNVPAFPISSAAWSKEEWIAHCRDVRTSFNQSRPLSADSLTLTAKDPRLVDFVYWVWANKILEHQIEQVGGTDWAGPTDGVIYHWAPGSHWERHTVAPLDDAIHHVTKDHGWTDAMFREFFEPFGPVKGQPIDERLSKHKPPTWAEFLRHIGSAESPYYRYIFHQEAAVDPKRRAVTMIGGQGVRFEYSFERYVKEAQQVLTDCEAYQFFQLYDQYGAGFAVPKSPGPKR